MRQRHFRLVAIAAAVPMLFGVAACGGDDGPQDRDALVDELAEMMASDEAGLGEEESRCVAEALVDEIGFDRLQEGFAGADNIEEVEDPELESEVSMAAMGAVMECVDMEGLLEQE